MVYFNLINKRSDYDRSPPSPLVRTLRVTASARCGRVFVYWAHSFQAIGPQEQCKLLSTKAVRCHHVRGCALCASGAIADHDDIGAEHRSCMVCRPGWALKSTGPGCPGICLWASDGGATSLTDALANDGYATDDDAGRTALPQLSRRPGGGVASAATAAAAVAAGATRVDLLPLPDKAVSAMAAARVAPKLDSNRRTADEKVGATAPATEARARGGTTSWTHQWSCVSVSEAVASRCEPELHATWQAEVTRSRSTNHTSDALPCGLIQDGRPPGRAEPSATPPLLVLTSTAPVAASNESRFAVRAAAATWAALAPEVQPFVAIGGDTDCKQAAQLYLGFGLLSCKVAMAGGAPVKDILLQAQATAESTGARFVGVASSGLAFDSSLIDVLRATAAAVDAGVIGKRVLIVGKRLNAVNGEGDARGLLGQYGAFVKMSASQQGNSTSRRTLREALGEHMRAASHRPSSTWAGASTGGFMFFTPGSVNIDELPDLAASTPGWEGWVVQRAADNGVDVVDATQQLLALRLGPGGANTHAPPGSAVMARLSRGWNQCALLDRCAARPDWGEFCSACLRCKAGAPSAGAFALRRNAERATAVVRLAEPRWDPASALENDAALGRGVLRRNRLPDFGAVQFLQAISRQEHPRGRLPQCVRRGTCCSVQGPAALEHELRLGWQVRGAWPTLASNADRIVVGDATVSGDAARLLRSEGVCTPWSWQGEAQYSFAHVPASKVSAVTGADPPLQPSCTLARGPRLPAR